MFKIYNHLHSLHSFYVPITAYYPCFILKENILSAAVLDLGIKMKFPLSLDNICYLHNFTVSHKPGKEGQKCIVVAFHGATNKPLALCTL